ncbi:MAG: GTPase [Francisellaceae bacterium]|nr:GTPase [Francisellaceae bacterium]
MEEVTSEGEQAVLVHLHLSQRDSSADLAEFKELAQAAGAQIAEIFQMNKSEPDAKFFIGSGKVEEIKQFIENNIVDLVLFNHELSPSQQRNLERSFDRKVLGRTALILDIFAQRARTFEGKLQVELAQLEQQSSRLVRSWTHLGRQKGGIGLRGPGETRLEVDRRLIRERIKYIKSRLEKVRLQRAQSRRSRIRASIPLVSLVGYTNAGKSTLFNALTGANVLVANQLFATLDPTIRTIKLPQIGKIAIGDTVGFIRNLPHHLVDAFRATLEETQNASLLLHVIDVNDEMWRTHAEQVEQVLVEVGANNIPKLEVYNKVDLLANFPDSELELNQNLGHKTVRISSITGFGIKALENAIAKALALDLVKGILIAPPALANIRAKLYDQKSVMSETLDSEGNWRLSISLMRSKWEQLCHFENTIIKYFTPECELKDEL